MNTLSSEQNNTGSDYIPVEDRISGSPFQCLQNLRIESTWTFLLRPWGSFSCPSQTNRADLQKAKEVKPVAWNMVAFYIRLTSALAEIAAVFPQLKSDNLV